MAVSNTFLEKNVSSKFPYANPQQEKEEQTKRKVLFVQDADDEFEVKKAMIEQIAYDRYGENSVRRNAFVDSYVKKLEEIQPEIDQDLYMAKAFAGKPDEWDYTSAIDEYTASLEGDMYNGKPLSISKKLDLQNKFHEKWVAREKIESKKASQLYTEEIMKSLEAAKNYAAENHGEYFLPKQVDEAFAKAKELGLMQYLAPEYWSYQSIATQNQVLMNENRARELYKKESLLPEEVEELAGIENILGYDRSVAIQQAVINVVAADDSIQAKKAAGWSTGGGTDTTVFTTMQGRIDRGEIGYEDVSKYIDQNRNLFTEEKAEELKAYAKGKTAEGVYIEALANEDFSRAMAEESLTGNLTEERVAELASEYSITDAREIQKATTNVKQINLQNAIKEIDEAQYLGTLTEARKQEIMDKYGLTTSDNASLLMGTDNAIRSANIQNVKDRFNALNIDDNITLDAVDDLIKQFGLTEEKDAALIKEMRDKAKANDERDKATEAGKADAATSGFAYDESVESTVGSVNTLIGLLEAGNVTYSHAMSYLNSKKGDLTREAYTTLKNRIIDAQNTRISINDDKYTEQIRKPFYNQKDTAMPGTAKKLFEDAGLDPADYQTQYDSMVSTELTNQHNVYAPVYQQNAMYLKLRELGYSDANIKTLGYYVPDMSMFDTVERIKNKADDDIPTSYEVAKKLAESSYEKLIPGEASKMVSSIDTKADEVGKLIQGAMSKKVRHNNPEAVQSYEYFRHIMDDLAYDTYIHELYLDGQITEATMKAEKALNLDDYHDPRTNAKKKAIDDFIKTASGDITGYKRTKDSEVFDNDFAINHLSNQMGSLFARRYDEAVAHSPNGQVDLIKLGKDVYAEFTTSYFTNQAENVTKMLRGDMTDMFSEGPLGLGQKRGSSYDFMLDFYRGDYEFYDTAALGRLLSEPQQGDEYLKDSGLIGHLGIIKGRGASQEEIGNNIIYHVANFLGLAGELPPLEDKDFASKADKLFKDLPPAVQSQFGFVAASTKMMFDVTNTMLAELGEDTVNALGGADNAKPVIQGNLFGIQIGETIMTYEPSRDGRSIHYSYIDDEGNPQLVTSKKSSIDNAEQTFKNTLSGIVGQPLPRYSDDQIASLGQPSSSSLFNNGEKYEGVIRSILEERITDAKNNNFYKNQAKNYLSTLNRGIFERNKLTGENNPFYSEIEVVIDEEKLTASLEANDGSFEKTPLGSFITYKLIKVRNQGRK